MVFIEVTGDKDDVDDGKESDEQSGVKTLEYTFGGGVKYMEVWRSILLSVCFSLLWLFLWVFFELVNGILPETTESGVSVLFNGSWNLVTRWHNWSKILSFFQINVFPQIWIKIYYVALQLFLIWMA